MTFLTYCHKNTVVNPVEVPLFLNRLFEATINRTMYVVLNCLKSSANHLSCKLCPLVSVKKSYRVFQIQCMYIQFRFYESDQTPVELTSYINICQEKSTNLCGTTSEIKKIVLCDWNMTTLCKQNKNKLNKEVIKDISVDLEPHCQIVRKLLEEIRKMPSNQQMLIGVSSGWILGLLAMRVGRTLALAVGGGLILLQVGCDMGYISVNWNELNQLSQDERNTSRVQNIMAKHNRSYQTISVPRWIKNALEFAKVNMTLSVGLLGGFLIGLATC